jgi:hypothetical protein
MQLRSCLHEAGFDIFHGPFAPSIYNDAIDSEGLVASGVLSKLPEEMTTTETSDTTTNAQHQLNPTEAYLIGNTKHLWPIFLKWLRDENDAASKLQGQPGNRTLLDEPAAVDSESDECGIWIKDPLDTYEQTVIRDIVARVCGWEEKGNESNKGVSASSSSCFRLYYSCDYDPATMVSMARIASCTGFSYLDPHTHLSVHPEFGTWHSYRAVLVLPAPVRGGGGDDDGSTRESLPISPTRLANPMSATDASTARDTFDRALEIGNGDYRQDDDDKDGGEEGDYTASSSKRSNTIKPSDAWIALRQTISIGKETYRFDEHQLRYHYTKDPSYLVEGIKGLR